MTEAERIAASELAAAAELALTSESDAVVAFGVMLSARVPLLMRGDVKPYCWDDEQLSDVAECGDSFNRLPSGDEPPPS